MTGEAKSDEWQADDLLDGFAFGGHELAELLLSRHAAALYRRVAGGVPPVQLQALTVLSAGDVRMRDLARRLGLATSTVTRLVDRLEVAGLAERRDARPDRRSVLVGLSPPGHEALQAVRSRLRSLVAELLAGLAAHEQGEFLRLLGKLGEGLTLPRFEAPPLQPSTP